MMDRGGNSHSRASSATTGVILMVGVVVFLSIGAMVSVFAFVLSPPSVAPQTAFEFDFTNNDSTDSLTIEHDFGNTASGDLIRITVRGAEPNGADGSYRWDGATLSGDSAVNHGSSVALNKTTIGDGETLNLDEATVVVTWRSLDEDHGIELDNWYGPDSGGAESTSNASDPGHAYVDTNGNGVWNAEVDTKIDDTEITDGVYNAGSDALVIPASVGPITANKIDIEGSDITIGVDLTATGNQDVTVEASGTLTTEDVTVESNSGYQILLSGETGVRANGIMIDSGSTVTVTSNSGEVHLSDGTLDATEKSGENVEVKSNGDLYLESTMIVTTAGGKAEAALQVDSATLYVDGASIEDGDDTLTYSPQDITVDGNPSSGSVISD